MIGFKKTATIVLLAGLGFTGTSQASLFDRGNGLIYDNVLNVTWLQDANYAHTSGYAGADSTGAMDWATAKTWAANLNYNGLTGWRLASNSPINGSSFNYAFAHDGSTDDGYNITSPSSELAYMYYVNLGLKGYFDTAGNAQSNWGIFGNGIIGDMNSSRSGQNNVGLVHNLQNSVYWSGSEYKYAPSPDINLDLASVFFTDVGIQVVNLKGHQYYAWAVRSGDVAAVPVPAAFWHFGSGLIGLLSFTRKKK